ncbi:polysaccharide deacetylase family protein [Sphingomonas sp. URHD0057]|uniref:polysaccharide deacetylase family protein n=1 Tax=Sphingomonas sp. URHD0057 TaxID=1380389 RepID=UPI00068878CB|nr:polysaccharide deacetylase family protein [Sphingomonas sp. URHD0057]
MRWLIAALLLLLAAPATAEKRIALTFDDVPRDRGAFFTPDERTIRLIAGLHEAGVRQAAFYIVPGQIGHDDGAGGEERIKAYVAAGHVIADHSFTHPHLSGMTAADYLADVDKAEAWLKGREGRRPWFRYPFLDEGQEDKAKRDAVRAGLQARGLHNGYATVDGSDWNIESLTADAVKAGKKVDMAGLRDLYVSTMVGAADFADQLSRKTWGRQPAQVIVLHETDIAALFIVDLVRAFRADGWAIITADEAYADPIAKLAPDVPSANGTLLELAAWEKGVPKPRWYERNDMTLANRLFAERVLHEAPQPPAH